MPKASKVERPGKRDRYGKTAESRAAERKEYEALREQKTRSRKKSARAGLSRSKADDDIKSARKDIKKKTKGSLKDKMKRRKKEATDLYDSMFGGY